LLLFKVIGQRIVLARRRRRWTEDDVAKRARVSRTTLSKIEHGRGNVTFGAVLEVCWVLGVPILGAIDLKEAEALLRDTELQLAALPMRVRSRRSEVPSDAF
jgi:transcriptional regulator with XRE-family HTH domain